VVRTFSHIAPVDPRASEPQPNGLYASRPTHARPRTRSGTCRGHTLTGLPHLHAMTGNIFAALAAGMGSFLAATTGWPQRLHASARFIPAVVAQHGEVGPTSSRVRRPPWSERDPALRLTPDRPRLPSACILPDRPSRLSRRGCRTPLRSTWHSAADGGTRPSCHADSSGKPGHSCTSRPRTTPTLSSILQARKLGVLSELESPRLFWLSALTA
jgi:hypothetical protein